MVKMKADTLKTIIRHAATAWPEECCGILLSETGARGVISMVMPSRNTAPDERDRRYRLDPKVQLQALELEVLGIAEVVGYYHSHPNGRADFSPEDRERSVEEAIYLVVGWKPGNHSVRAWRRKSSGPVEETLRVED